MQTHLRLLVLLFALITPACDGIFSVRGRVATTSGMPVVGAEVLAYDGRLRATTDADGCFDLAGVCSPRKHETFLLIRFRGRVQALGTVDAPVQRTGTVTIGDESDPTATFTPGADVGVCGARR